MLASVLFIGQASARPRPLLTGQSAAADVAATAATNPAGMTRFDKTQVRLDLYYLQSESTWRENFGSTGFARVTTTDSDLVVPNIALAKPLSDKWFFGFSMLGYSISDDYGEAWVGRYVIEEYELVFVSAFPSVAYKVNDNWSVAASLAATYTSFTQEKSVFNLPEPGNPNPDDGDLEIDADGFTAGFGFSTLYEFSDRTRIGFNYTSELEPDLDGNLDYSNLTSTTEMLLDAAGLLDARVDVDTRSPQKANVGVYHEFENRHAITADINWIDFSRFKLSEIYINGGQVNESDLDYDDIWTISAGYSFPVGDRVVLAVAGIYVSDMVDDDSRQLSLRFDDAWGLGAGIEWRWSDKWRVDATIGYTEMGDSPVTTDDIEAIGGPISGRFTDREFWILQLGLEWGPGPR
ncbi:MAG: OmpP1/FadL family transporter [Gammaproteobacteria bacterium]